MLNFLAEILFWSLLAKAKKTPVVFVVILTVVVVALTVVTMINQAVYVK
jgi:hypothetical protein